MLGWSYLALGKLFFTIALFVLFARVHILRWLAPVLSLALQALELSLLAIIAYKDLARWLRCRDDLDVRKERLLWWYISSIMLFRLALDCRDGWEGKIPPRPDPFKVLVRLHSETAFAISIIQNTGGSVGQTLFRPNQGDADLDLCLYTTPGTFIGQTQDDQLCRPLPC